MDSRLVRLFLLALLAVHSAAWDGARAQPVEVTVSHDPATHVGEAFYGIQHHENTYDAPLALGKLSRLPLHGVRVWAYPSQFHPQPGVWDWEALDATIDEVVGAGYAPFVCLFQAEEWYVGTPDAPWWHDEQARSEWRLAAHALAERYGDRVDWWIVFDEVNYLFPDRPYYMSFGMSADVYVDAAHEIKNADSQSSVGGPSGFAGWENGYWASHVLAREEGEELLDFVSSNIFLSWDRTDTDAEIMDRTIWYEEAPRKMRQMIATEGERLALLLDAYNASALWTYDGTPQGEPWTDPRNVNTFGGVYQTAALLHAARGGFDVTLRWETLGGFGILTWYPDFEERPPYYAWRLLAEHGRLRPASYVLGATTTEPPLPDLPHHSGMDVDGYTVQPFAVANDEGISVLLINKYGNDRQVAVARPTGMDHYEVYRFDDTRHETSLSPLRAGDEDVVALVAPALSVTVVKFYDASVTTTEPVGVPDASATLLGNVPNPFRSTTRIRFVLPSESRVTLDVYSPLGRRIARLYAGTLPGGEHTVAFKGDGVSAGLYVSVLCVDGTCVSRPMTVVR